MKKSFQTLRLLLGDQLNYNHSWFETVEEDVLYVLMEIKPESEYVTHHIQKVVGIFAAMRAFADALRKAGHQVAYYTINQSDNLHSFAANCNQLIEQYEVQQLEYQAPDEYRLDELLRTYTAELAIKTLCASSEHFYTERTELRDYAEGKKSVIMEHFYRNMRRKHQVLMDGSDPLGGKWNYDGSNRKKLPKGHKPAAPKLYAHDVQDIYAETQVVGLKTIGNIDAKHFIWPITREEAQAVLVDFIERLLPLFGTYQDAMHEDYWSIYHSRLSFAMNTKMISPQEIVQAAEQAYWDNDAIDITQVEGFIRQILGWREFMRGIYWMKMPDYATENFLEAKRGLPAYFWNGNTKMNCMQHAIQQSLDYAYAHHIQRLMITGNFCLMAGIDPSAVDEWYLGIYIDAFEWVEITNTRGMSQYADGGLVATKPYCSSANYIDKMSNYCKNCYYDKKQKTGDKACPFNSLYWNFLDQHREKLASNMRMSMMYRLWDKKDSQEKTALLEQAAYYLEKIESL
jgi:deoxyribodipyrimidine photolyase-related protein